MRADCIREGFPTARCARRATSVAGATTTTGKPRHPATTTSCWPTTPVWGTSSPSAPVGGISVACARAGRQRPIRLVLRPSPRKGGRRAQLFAIYRSPPQPGVGGERTGRPGRRSSWQRNGRRSLQIAGKTATGRWAPDRSCCRPSTERCRRPSGRRCGCCRR